MARTLMILDGRLPPEIPAGCESIDLQAFVARAYAGDWWRQLKSFETVRLLTQHPECLPRRWLLQVLLWLLATRSCEIEGADGRRQRITVASLGGGVAALLSDALVQFRIRRDTRAKLNSLEHACRNRNRPRTLRSVDGGLYLKTDLWLGVPAGGSVAHMAGVANELARLTERLKVWSATPNPLLAAGLAVERLEPPRRFWDFREVPALAFNAELIGRLSREIETAPPGWIYQRYSLHNFAGLWAAERLGVPLVLEYNGSEIWIGDHWGSGLRFRELAARIEWLNLQGADLVVVVSEASKAELVARGVAPERILVNPNGVDVERYSPDIDSAQLRAANGLAEKTVIGFIGTFGRWHGAEVLVDAFARLCHETRDPDSLRLLLIGDGPMRPECERRAAKLGISDRVIFAGVVPQVEGPRWLAACDVLVAPHVPNADGTMFFGSPTKLFEYMAMARPIVSSQLGQMAELLEHGRTAWLVEPGSPEALASGLQGVLGDPSLGRRMASEARREAVEKHTWQAHTQRIVDRLRAACA